jgi:hypothetical protein
LVIDGVPLAEAMNRAPDVFPRIYVAMVEAGEAGGFLDVVLGQIADFQAREKELRAKVMAALMYPAVLLFLAIAVLVFLMVFFIPRFQTLFEGFDAALPALTQVIVASFSPPGSSVAAGFQRTAAGGSGNPGCCAPRSSARSPRNWPWPGFAGCSGPCSGPAFL